MRSQSRLNLKINIVANFAGLGSSFLVGMIAVPFYIRFLGIDGYGLVGFYATLQAVFNSFLDFGFSVTINRELARYLTSPVKNDQSQDLVRTMEIAYWLIGLFLGGLVCLAAPRIATYWLNSDTISESIIRNVVFLMGIITFVQWPLTLYQGALIGLQRMVLLNVVNTALVILRGVGGVLILWFHPSLMVFFLWQLFISVLQVCLTMILLWRSLPASDHSPRFNPTLLRSTWRFAAGMTATSFFSFFIDYGDRLILSKILNLEYFGYYSLATTLNDQLQLISAPIHRALFPQLSSLVETNDFETLKNLYHKASQYVSVAILPIVGTAVVFASQLILIWTQDVNITNQVVPIASLLFMGTIFINLMGVPYTLTLAYGWAKPGFYRALIAFLVLLPLTLILSLRYAGVGAALAWAIFNLGSLILFPLLVHRTLLKTELKHWLIADIGIPAITSTIILVIIYWMIPASLSVVQLVLIVLFVLLFTFGCTVLSAQDIRGLALEYIRKFTSYSFKQKKSHSNDGMAANGWRDEK
jgi:O-antigen/teichoic acid export membrane protein